MRQFFNSVLHIQRELSDLEGLLHKAGGENTSLTVNNNEKEI
jgi:hypothetical protein